MDAEGRSALLVGCGAARVDREFPGREEEHQGQVPSRRQQGGVVGNQLAADPPGLGAVDRRREPRVPATAEEAVEVVVQPVRLMIEGADEVGNRGAQDHGGIVDRHVSL